MRYGLLVSTSYYVCGCFFMLFGIYTVASNTKSRTNRLFLLVTSAMAIWSFSYSISNTAPTAEASAFWRCMSVFGWGIFHSLLLHFVLILTKTKIGSRFKKRIVVAIIHAPAVINFILFAPFGLLGMKQYEMVPGDFGWRNVLPANIGQYWINFYYVTYSVVSVILLIRWWKEFEPHTPLRRQISYFLISLFFTFFVGSITDILPGVLGIKQIPKLAILFMVPPTTMLFVTLRKFGVLIERPKAEYFPPDSDTLPDLPEERLRLFETASGIFIIGAVGSFYSGYFIAKEQLASELLLAAGVLILGILLRFIPFITKKQTIQNTLFLIMSIVGMSFFIIANIDTGAVTVWAVYVVFLLYTVVLNSDIHAFLFLAATLIIQVVVGITHPQVYAVIDTAQYLKRLFIIVLSFFAVRYLTNEYASKLRGYQKFAQEQEMLEKISSSFISVNNENAKEKTDEALKQAAEILGYSHAYLIEFSDDFEDATVLNTYVESVEHASIPYHTGMKVKTATLPMAQPLIAQGRPITCEDFMNNSDDEAGEQRNFFLSRGIHSFCALPIRVDDQLKAMLVVEHGNRIDKNLRERQLYFLRMIVNILGDAKKKNAYEDRLYQFAYFDGATKLANRNMLIQKLDQRIQDNRESGKTAVLNIELENLRIIKDSFGHAVGEQMVIQSAKMIENLLEESCDVARSAEGTFVVVLPQVENNEQIEKCAQRLLDTFSHPILTETGIEALFVVIHIGISVYPDDGKDTFALLKNADLAGFHAKSTNQKMVFYTGQLESHIAENALFTNRLFQSLQNKEFSLEFQPQISCNTGKTVGVEALLRWTTDGNSRVPPDRFIPILEQTGLIYDVGLWVLEQALQEHNRLVSKGFPPLRFSINISVVQFQADDFIRDFTDRIKKSGVDPKYLELEITESVFSANPAVVLEKIHKLKELGIKIAIDDFGKGYSTLNRLKLVPFDRLKIDKEIIDYIDLQRKLAPLTEIIILLARAFKASVTAEGVEKKEQAEFLKSIACDEIQGYYFSRPLSPEALEAFLKTE